MEKFKIWPYIFASLMGILVGMGTMDLIHRSDQSDVIKADADTTFSKVRLDSIKVKQ